jgi:hypothetical protein
MVVLFEAFLVPTISEELAMRNISLAILAVAAPMILSAGPIDFTTGTPLFDTTSFNGSPTGTLTLGANSCPNVMDLTCTLTATQLISGVTYTVSLTQPNDATSPFSYNGLPSTITTAGSPTLSFALSDSDGDSATGKFSLTSLASDGVPVDGFDGIDIDGSATITSITPGSNISNFDSLFGLPSSTPLSFVLDVGGCETNGKSPTHENCVEPSDPTAQFISFDLSPGTPSSSVPEPGTFELLGAASGAMFVVVKLLRAKKS